MIIPKISPNAKLFMEKRVKFRIFAYHYVTKNRPKKITMHLDLDNIIKYKFTTNFDRYAN